MLSDGKLLKLLLQDLPQQQRMRLLFLRVYLLDRILVLLDFEQVLEWIGTRLAKHI